MNGWRTPGDFVSVLSGLPDGWQIARLGSTSWVRARLGWRGLTADEYVDQGVAFLSTPDIKNRSIEYGVVNRISEARYNESPEIMLNVGDVLLTKDGSTIGIVNVVRELPEPTTVNGSIAVMTPDHEWEPRLLGYVLASTFGQALMALLQDGMGVPHLFQRDIRKMNLPRPPVAQQAAIADFLDRETAQIDTMIEAQQGVVDRLSERRSATVTSLVTGRTTGVRLVPSGDSLLGNVPEGWEVGRFGRHTRINGGQVDPSVEPWSEMILVAPNHVESGTGRLTTLETAAEQGADSGKYLVRSGQIIYSKIRPSLNKVTIAPEDVLCSADMYGITCLGQADHRFFANFMRATPFHQYATMVSDRVKMPKINREELAAAPWLIPPLAEQERIADLLEATTRELDRTIFETRALSMLLRERREALITAAVTGRIDPETGIERIDPTTEKEAS